MYKCPYCGADAKLVPASTVHKINNDKEKVWICSNYPKCDSYVGCHSGTEIPLGRLANEKLRQLKIKAHREFDVLWKSGIMTRHEAYEWLASMLHMEVSECHIGKFSPEMCNRVIKICHRQDNSELRKYRLEHFGYEQDKPVFTRGYSDRKNKH